MHSRKVFYWSVTAALGGFLFGFDVAVISGGEQAIQQQWGLGPAMLGQMVAMAIYGTIAGAMFGGIPAQRWGRKPTIMLIAVLYLVSAAGSALAPEIHSLMFFRFIGGLGVGASSVVGPMYISEIAPAAKRGRLAALFQFNIVLGILVAYFSNFLIGAGQPDSWRWMLGAEVLPALVFLAAVRYLPESPRWLIVAKDRTAEARRILAVINPDAVDASVEEIRASRADREGGLGLRDFFSWRYSFPIMLAFLIALFNQMSGINAVIYFAPRVFSLTGMGAEAALLSTVGIGVVNLLFTMVGLTLIDRFGRRFLMFIGSTGYIISLSLVAYAFLTGTFVGYSVPILLFVFVASHAIGQGLVIWVFISEIFPNTVRSYGNSFGSATVWVFAALIAGNFVYFESLFGGGPIFAFFAFMMVLQLLFVWRVMPETRGVSLEQLEERLLTSRSKVRAGRDQP